MPSEPTDPTPEPSTTPAGAGRGPAPGEPPAGGVAPPQPPPPPQPAPQRSPAAGRPGAPGRLGAPPPTLLRQGDTGESVRDVQQRLRQLGFGVPDVEEGTYGPGTASAVTAFQVERGLRDDGICGPQTWNAVVEAGWSLGQRLLYYRNRMLRGDDIAALQRTLGALGFDAGKVDGIFGPQTHDALIDFQRNAGLTVDGICGPATLETLARISSRADEEVVAGVRERVRLRERAPTLHGRRVVVGETGGAAALADAIRRALTRTGASVVTLHDHDESSLANQANALEAEVYLGLRLDGDRCGCRAAFFRGRHGFESEGGRRLAAAVQGALPAAVGVPDLGVQGMTLPVLRETRMPAVVIELGPASSVVPHSADVATAVATALQEWVRAPYP